MSIAKKGRRRILVDGKPYHFAVVGNRASIRLSIQGETKHGQRLSTFLDYYPIGMPLLRCNWWSATFTVTPSLVAQVIRQGLDRGWLPEEQLPEFRLAPEGVVPDHAHFSSACEKPTRRYLLCTDSDRRKWSGLDWYWIENLFVPGKAGRMNTRFIEKE